ncbi:hypothetical protein CGRA01v4_10319 [Colletotrichum graminicola]|nr:hypothetical protein CGRA01v4_10319 [Colletotrichum graminicola]
MFYSAPVVHRTLTNARQTFLAPEHFSHGFMMLKLAHIKYFQKVHIKNSPACWRKAFPPSYKHYHPTTYEEDLNERADINEPRRPSPETNGDVQTLWCWVLGASC